MPRRRKHQPIEQQGDGILWPQFLATGADLDLAELQRRESLARDLVEGRLDVTAWLSGEA